MNREIDAHFLPAGARGLITTVSTWQEGYESRQETYIRVNGEIKFLSWRS